MKPALLLTDSDAFAGTERHILDLAAGLRSAGAPTLVGCPAGTPLASACEEAGISTLTVEKRGLVDFSAAVQLAALLRKRELGLIHAHNGRTALVAALARRLAGRGAAVMTQHFIHPDHTGRTGRKAHLTRKAHLWVGRELRRVVAISPAVAEAILERGDTSPEKIRVIPNGIREPNSTPLRDSAEVRRELGLTARNPLVVCVARLEAEKDVSTLIAAIGKVVERRPEVACVIAGEGSLRGRLEQEIREAGAAGKCRLLGFRSDARALIAAGDLFVLPSRAEPAGLVLLEAMALGRPVVAANAGGPRDIVVEGVSGQFFTPGRSDELCAVMLRLLADPDHAKRLGVAGRQRYERHYTADRMCADTLSLYESLWN